VFHRKNMILFKKHKEYNREDFAPQIDLGEPYSDNKLERTTTTLSQQSKQHTDNENPTLHLALIQKGTAKVNFTCQGATK